MEMCFIIIQHFQTRIYLNHLTVLTVSPESTRSELQTNYSICGLHGYSKTISDMSRVTLNFDLSKIPFVHF